MRRIPLFMSLVALAACAPELPPDGQTWSVDTTSVTWVEPDGADLLAEAFATTYPFYLAIQEIEGDSATFLMAIGVDDDQDFCSRTVRMNDVTLNPDLSFTFGPADFAVANGFTTEDLSFTGQIREDFSTITDIAFEGNLNLGTAPPDMLPLGDALSPCDLVSAFDMSCNACADGSDDCLQASVTGGTAAHTPDITLEEIELADCHAQCGVSEDNPECSL